MQIKFSRMQRLNLRWIPCYFTLFISWYLFKSCRASELELDQRNCCTPKRREPPPNAFQGHFQKPLQYSEAQAVVSFPKQNSNSMNYCFGEQEKKILLNWSPTKGDHFFISPSKDCLLNTICSCLSMP